MELIELIYGIIKDLIVGIVCIALASDIVEIVKSVMSYKIIKNRFLDLENMDMFEGVKDGCED